MMKKVINIMLIVVILLGFFSFFGKDLIESITMRNNTELPFCGIQGIVADTDGDIYIALLDYEIIQVYDKSGKYLKRWNVMSYAGSFRIDITKENTIAVYPARGSVISHYKLNGDYITHSKENDLGYVFPKDNSMYISNNGEKYEITGYYPKIKKDGIVIIEQNFILKILTFPQSFGVSFVAFIFLILLNRQVRKNRKRYPNYFVYIYERLLKK
jgi:hypothetical protein